MSFFFLNKKKSILLRLPFLMPSTSYLRRSFTFFFIYIYCTLPIFNQFKKWYSYEELKYFKEKYYEHLKQIGKNFPVVEWFNLLDLPQIFVSKEIKTCDASYGKTITSKYP